MSLLLKVDKAFALKQVDTLRRRLVSKKIELRMGIVKTFRGITGTLFLYCNVG